MIFVLRDPGVRWDRQLRPPADDRRARTWRFPAAECAELTGCCPSRALLFVGSFAAPGGAFDAGWTGYAPLSTGAPLGQSFFNLGVQFAGGLVDRNGAQLSWSRS